MPAERAGIIAVSVPASTDTTFDAGMTPTVTVAPGANDIPEMVAVVPPAADPDGGSTEKTIRWENSDVLPNWSVAVAVTSCPAARTKGTSIAKGAVPKPSVVTWSDSRYVSPWR